MPLAINSITTVESVIDFAISLEKFGQEFYLRARDMVSDASCKELFTWLMEEEEDHCKTYEELYKNQMGKTSIESDLLGGYGRFIAILVKEITEALTVSENLTLIEALDKALVFEDTVLRYFQEVKNLFSEKQQLVIEIICAEEKKHIDAILEFKKNNT